MDPIDWTVDGVHFSQISSLYADLLAYWRWIFENIAFILPILEEMKLPEKFVFFFGRVVRRKGLGWFLREVLPLLPQELVVLAAGTIWEEEELSLIDSTRFRHLGVVKPEDLSRCCRDAICVVMPNISCEDEGDVEGFGLVAVEAAAMGAVVLAASTDGLLDAIKSGSTGYLLKPGDVNKWVVKIKEVLDWSGEHRSVFLKTISSRTHATESINRENLKGVPYLNCGDHYIVRDGREYSMLQPVWQWKYLPGITLLHKRSRQRLQSFVGGIGNGQSGLSVIDYVRISKGNKVLAVRKAWFFYKNIVICLMGGTGCVRRCH